MIAFINKLMVWQGVVLSVLLLTSLCLSMKNHGFTTVLLPLNLSYIDVTLMTVFFSSNPSTMHLFFLTILTTSILTSPSHPSWKKTASFLSSMLKYLAQTVNFSSLFVYRKPTFTGLFTNFHSFIPLAYKRPLVSC